MELECVNCHSILDIDVSRLNGKDLVNCPVCDLNTPMPHPAVQPGFSISGFDLIKEIGVGHMGHIYLADQIALQRKAIVRILPPAMSSDHDFLKSFVREIVILGKLNHPHICALYDGGEEKQIHYMALEYVDGPNLRDLLRETSQLAEEKVLLIMRQVAEALDYAFNNHGILHLDLKPSSIMLNRKGRAKLTGMGIIRDVSEGVSYSHSGLLMGTPHYMSPERAVEGGLTDPRSDMYSFGATMYHLLTGTPPFPGDDVTSILTQHITKALQPAKERAKVVTQATSDFIQVLMAKSPDDRYEDWGAVRADLEKIIRGGSKIEKKSKVFLNQPGIDSSRMNLNAPKGEPRSNVYRARVKGNRSTINPGSIVYNAPGGTGPIVVVGAAQPIIPPMVSRPKKYAKKLQRKEKNNKDTGKQIGLVILAIACVGMIFFVVNKAKEHKAREVIAQEKLRVATEQAEKEAAIARKKKTTKAVFEAADFILDQDPFAYSKAIKAFDKFIKTHPESELLEEATEKLGFIKSKREDILKQEKIMLEKSANALLQSPQLSKASDVFQNYSGTMKHELGDYLNLKSQEFAQKAADRQMMLDKNIAQGEEILSDLAKDLAAFRFMPAKEKLTSLKELEGCAALWKPIQEDIEGISDWREEVLDYVMRLQGRKHSFKMKSGKEVSLMVHSVQGPDIVLEQSIIVGTKKKKRQLSFMVDDLSEEGKLELIEGSGKVDASLMKGLFALQKDDEETARTAFGESTSKLAPLLLDNMSGYAAAGPSGKPSMKDIKW